jgi:hypothetical protein
MQVVQTCGRGLSVLGGGKMGFDATLEVVEPLREAGLLAEWNLLDMVGLIFPNKLTGRRSCIIHHLA